MSDFGMNDADTVVEHVVETRDDSLDTLYAQQENAVLPRSRRQGRPWLSDEPRDFLFTMRMTGSERYALDAAAAEAGVSRTEYVRTKLGLDG